MRAGVLAAVVSTTLLAGTLGAWAGSTTWDTQNLSDAEFFGLLDYDRFAGLSKVEAAVNAGDYPLAKRELLTYYRNRPANNAGSFTHKDWPGVLELTPDHIWTLGSGEVYLTTLRLGTAESTVTADVTNVVTATQGGAAGFLLMSRIKEPVTASINSAEKSTGKPGLRLTMTDGSVRTLRPTEDTHITAGNSTPNGDKTLLQVRDQGPGAFHATETRKAYLQFDLTGVSGVRSAQLALTGRADAAKDVMLFSNAETFDESTRTWANTKQYTYSWQGDPGGFNWKPPATGADNEYNWQLTRFYFAGPLARAYDRTGDEKYADSLIRIMTDFVSDADGYGTEYGAGSYPRGLDTARRLENWAAAHEILRKSPSLSAEENVRILKTMHRSGVFLTTNVHGNPNWMQTQKFSLLRAAVYLPEFKAATGWRTNGADFLGQQLNDSTYPDGGYWEATSSYARGYASQYVEIVEFMQANGIAFPAMEKLRKLAHFLMDQTMPNGNTANYGDSGIQDQRSVLLRLGNLLDDDELIYVGTAGKSGTRPAHRSAVYKDTRVAVSRSGWSTSDSYLRYNIDRGNHSHPDEMSLVAHAHGRDLLPDMGTYSYSDDPRSNWLRKSTESHNTIEIDDKVQNSTAAGAITHFVANPAFDLISGNTDASSGAWHARSVLSLRSASGTGLWLVSDQLKPRDGGSHRYEQNWHFLPDAGITLNSTTKATATAFGSGANLTVVPADPGKLTASVRDGYYSPEFYHVSGAKYSSYVKTAGRTSFDTLLLPSAAAADGSVRVNRLAVGTLTPDQVSALDIRFGDGVRGTYYKSWDAKAARTFGTYRFDGKLLYVQDGTDGSVRSIALYDGQTVERGGAVLVKAPAAVNNLAVTFAGGGSTVRIDGNALTASTDPAKAIGIAAPNATEVLLNGTRVDFTRSGGLIYAAAA